MKNRMLQIITVLFLVFISTTGTCFAIEIGNENAQIDFYAEEEGVYYVITDPQGRRVGYDVVTKQYLEEFSAEFFISLAEGDKISGRDEISEKFHGDAMFNLMPGAYTIEVIGVGLTDFDISIGISRRIQSEGITAFDFTGIIDKDLTSKFQFIYNSDPSKPAGIATRIATPSNLKQDIALSRKIGWIDNDGIMNSLLKKAKAIEASISKGNKTSAKNQLNAFINEVNAQKGKHISDKAAKILLEDAQYILENLNK